MNLQNIELQRELSDLNKKIYFLEKSNRELQRELNDYTIRELELVEEIERLSRQLIDERNKNQPPAIDYTATTKEEFLAPKLPTAVGGKKDTTGYEKDWDAVMFAYTDEIFINTDSPDLLLYRDEREQAYVSITSSTKLYFPICDKVLDKYNIIYVRKLTPAEEEEVIRIYGIEK